MEDKKRKTKKSLKNQKGQGFCDNYLEKLVQTVEPEAVGPYEIEKLYLNEHQFLFSYCV